MVLALQTLHFSLNIPASSDFFIATNLLALRSHGWQKNKDGALGGKSKPVVCISRLYLRSFILQLASAANRLECVIVSVSCETSLVGEAPCQD